MKFRVNTRGFAELELKLMKLKEVQQRRALASAGRYAMEPVAETARSLAPVDEGNLRDSIRIRAKARSTMGKMVLSKALRGLSSGPDVEIGILMSRRKLTGEIDIGDGNIQKITMYEAGWRWHFAEFGTAHHAAHPFLRPAFDMHGVKILDRLGERLRANLAKLLG